MDRQTDGQADKQSICSSLLIPDTKPRDVTEYCAPALLVVKADRQEGQTRIDRHLHLLQGKLVRPRVSP